MTCSARTLLRSYGSWLTLTCSGIVAGFLTRDTILQHYGNVTLAQVAFLSAALLHVGRHYIVVKA